MLFTFPSRYLFAFGCQVVFSLRRWSFQIRTGLHVSRTTRVSLPKRPEFFAYGALTLYGRLFQCRSTKPRFFYSLRDMSIPLTRPHNPSVTKRPCHMSPKFRLFPFRSPLLGESLSYFIFLEVLRCFSSLGWLSHPMDSDENLQA